MNPGLVIVLTFAAVCQFEIRQPSSVEAKRDPGSALHALNLADAGEYRLYRDVQKEEMLELRRQPIFAWTNPTRDGGSGRLPEFVVSHSSDGTSMTRDSGQERC